MGYVFWILAISLVYLDDVITLTTAADHGPGKEEEVISIAHHTLRRMKLCMKKNLCSLVACLNVVSCIY